MIYPYISVLPEGSIVAWVPTEETPLPRGWMPCDGERWVKAGPWQGQKTHDLRFRNTFGVFGKDKICKPARDYPLGDNQTLNCSHEEGLHFKEKNEKQNYIWIMKYH